MPLELQASTQLHFQTHIVSVPSWNLVLQQLPAIALARAVPEHVAVEHSPPDLLSLYSSFLI
jgi:hypothetical protein